MDFVSKSIIRNECGEGLMVAGDVAKRAADESGVAFGSSVDEDEASEKCSFVAGDFTAIGRCFRSLGL